MVFDNLTEKKTRTLKERRAPDEVIDRIVGLEQDIKDIKLQMNSIQTSVSVNTKITSDGMVEINAKLAGFSELLETYMSVKKFGRFIAWCAKNIQIIAVFVVAVGGAVLAYLKLKGLWFGG